MRVNVMGGIRRGSRISSWQSRRGRSGLRRCWESYLMRWRGIRFTACPVPGRVPPRLA